MSDSKANYDSAVQTARAYYNSEDADNFYFNIWGGEDIHVGLYDPPSEPIADASHKTVQRMAQKLKTLSKDSKVLDVGAGYGGSMRYLAKAYGCHCVALNLSEVENERDRQMNKDQGLDKLIDVVDGDFTSLPYDDASFDIVWSQDAILHSGDREKVMAEIARVLKPGGELVFTDPMMADDCPKDVLEPILGRIQLDTLGSPGFYKKAGEANGLTLVEYEDHAHQLTNHYTRVREELTSRADEIQSKGVSREYTEKMKTGLGHWIEGGKNGHLAWGIFHFTKK